MSHRSPKPKKRGMKEDTPVDGPPSSSSRKDRKRELYKSEKDGNQLEPHDLIMAAFQNQKGSEHLGKRKTEILSELPTQLPSKSSLKITTDPPPSININQTRSKRKLMCLDQSRNKSISPERGGFRDTDDSSKRENKNSEPEPPKLFGTTSLSKLGHFAPNSQMRLGSHFSSMSFSEASRSSQPSTKHEASTNSSVHRVATLPINLPLHMPIPPCLVAESVLEFSQDSFDELVRVVKTAWLKFYLKKYAIGPKPGEELQMPPLSSNKFWQIKSLVELAQKPQVRQYLHKHYSRALEDTIQDPGFETKLLYGEKGGLLVNAPPIEEGPIKYLGRFGLNQIIREKKRWEAGVLISKAYEQLKASLPPQSKEQSNNQGGSRTDNVQLGKLSVYSKRKKAIPEESDESGSDDSDSDSKSGTSSDDGSDSSSESHEKEERPTNKQPPNYSQQPPAKLGTISRTISISQPAQVHRTQQVAPVDDNISKANYFITKLNNKKIELLNSEVQQIIQQSAISSLPKATPPLPYATITHSTKHNNLQLSALRHDERSHRSKIFNKSPSEDKHKAPTEAQPEFDSEGPAYDIHDHQHEKEAPSQSRNAANQAALIRPIPEQLSVQMELSAEVKIEESPAVVTHQQGNGAVGNENRPQQVKVSGSTRSIHPQASDGLSRIQGSHFTEHTNAVQISDDVVKVEASEPREIISVDKKAKQSTQKAVRKMLESAVTSNISAATIAGSVFLKEAIKNTANDSYSHEKVVGFDTQVGASIPGQAEMVENRKFRRVRRKLSFTITLERDEFLPDDFQETPDTASAPIQQQASPQLAQSADGGLRFQSLSGINLAATKPALGKRDPLEALERTAPVHQPVQSDQVSHRPTLHQYPMDRMMLEPSLSSPSPTQGIMALQGLEVKYSRQYPVQVSSQQYSRLEEPQIQDPVVALVEKSFDDSRNTPPISDNPKEVSVEPSVVANDQKECIQEERASIQEASAIQEEEEDPKPAGTSIEEPAAELDPAVDEAEIKCFPEIASSTIVEAATVTKITETEEEIPEPEMMAAGIGAEQMPPSTEQPEPQESEVSEQPAHQQSAVADTETAADHEQYRAPN